MAALMACRECDLWKLPKEHRTPGPEVFHLCIKYDKRHKLIRKCES